MTDTRDELRARRDEVRRQTSSTRDRHPFSCGCYGCLDDRGEVEPTAYCWACRSVEVKDPEELCDLCRDVILGDEEDDRSTNEEREKV